MNDTLKGLPTFRPILTVDLPGNGDYIVNGMQLRPRRFVPKSVGDFILWLFFHRLDTKTQIHISGLAR